MITQGYENGGADDCSHARASSSTGAPAGQRALSSMQGYLCPLYREAHIAAPCRCGTSGARGAVNCQCLDHCSRNTSRSGPGVSSVVVSHDDTLSPGSVLSIIMDIGSNPLLYLYVFIEGLLGSAPGAPTISLNLTNHRAIFSEFKEPPRCIDRSQKLAIHIRGFPILDICGHTCSWSASGTSK